MKGNVSALCLCLFLTSSCAWSNPDNRPVWNSFEAHAVPEDPTWFALSLPLIVPLGLLAVLVDSLVAHPIQVIDEAVGDAGDLWSGIGEKLDQHYYTQTAYLPVRAVVETPVVFLGSFLGRSMFDVSLPSDARDDPDCSPEHAKAQVVEWLDQIDTRPDRRFPYAELYHFDLWDAEMLAHVEVRLTKASVLGRLKIYRVGVHLHVQAIYEAGLKDPDAGLRFLVLSELSKSHSIREDVLSALRRDSVESIRVMSEQR